MLNGDLAAFEHIGGVNVDQPYVRGQLYALLYKYVLKVEEKPIITQLFLLVDKIFLLMDKSNDC